MGHPIEFGGEYTPGNSFVLGREPVQDVGIVLSICQYNHVPNLRGQVAVISEQSVCKYDKP
jgi:hypothetical protein